MMKRKLFVPAFLFSLFAFSGCAEVVVPLVTAPIFMVDEAKAHKPDKQR